MVWARGLGLAQIVGWLECQDPHSVCTIKAEGEYEPWCLSAPLTQGNSPLTGTVLGPDPSYSSWPFNPWQFFCVPEQRNLLTVPQDYPSTLQFATWGEGAGSSICYHVSVSFAFLYVVSLSFVVQLLFSQPSVLHRFDVSVKKMSSQSLTFPFLTLESVVESTAKTIDAQQKSLDPAKVVDNNSA